MTTPVWVLLGFAGWTLLILSVTIGVYRWSRILAGTARFEAFRADAVEGTDFYKRSMRAHANCIENLPVYGAIVLAAQAGGVDDATLDMLAVGFLGARVVHTLVHVCFVQTSAVGYVRFGFYSVQLVCMVWMGIHEARLAH
jgi:uncharacterized MAPEG superfamily protein